MQIIKARARKIGEILDTYIPNPEIPLHHLNPFTLLVAVLLSAHTTDAGVNRVTPRLFKKAKTAEEMATLSIAELEEILRPVGLFKVKAKYLYSLSLMLIKEHHGEVPKSLAALEKLPGVGHKTASVVMCQAFQVPAFPVDTHIFRCARRWKLSSEKTVSGVEKDLKKVFPKKEWARRHLQIILFGRTYCKAKAHDSEKCPICGHV